MRRALFLTMLFAMSVFVTGTYAAASDGGMGRIPTVTRLVRMFSELEGNLIKAVEKQDAKAVAQLLSDDFEMRVGAMPGNPIPRAAWIRQSFAEPKSSSLLTQMAVHDFGKTAVVSFSRRIKDANSDTERNIFIVDIWTQAAGEWKLSVRYAGPVEKDDSPLPGAAMTAPAFEKKE